MDGCMGFLVPVNGDFLHMTRFYAKKVKDLMALIRQILNF
jgi:hypothetical protein